MIVRMEYGTIPITVSSASVIINMAIGQFFYQGYGVYLRGPKFCIFFYFDVN